VRVFGAEYRRQLIDHLLTLRGSAGVPTLLPRAKQVRSSSQRVGVLLADNCRHPVDGLRLYLLGLSQLTLVRQQDSHDRQRGEGVGMVVT
jgi:hypothetical protein